MPIGGLNRRERLDIYRLIRTELLPIARMRFPDLRAGRADLRTRLSGGKTFTAKESGGHTVGFIHLIDRGPSVWIDMLAVDRACQGKGVGRQLLRRAERYATGRNAKCIKLLVDVDNVKAIRFYGNSGFSHIRYHPKTYCYEFGKALKASKRLSTG